MDTPISPEALLRAAGASVLEPPTVDPPGYSDDAVALAFSDRHADGLLYVPQWKRWLRWDGARWAPDETLAVADLIRVVCREQAANAHVEVGRRQEWHVARLASAQKVAAVEQLARSDLQHARTPEAFDTDPWALNTPGGVVDLRTGTIRAHRRTDLFTKVTAVAPSGDCGRWLRFLIQITQGDEAAIRYLQRWVDYMLTGSVREHAFLFLYGPGGNGKSVFLNVLMAVLGDYARAADMDLFTAQTGSQHPTGLADLRGARLVVAQETDAGGVLAEARIKAMTGGDRVKARFMNRDFFEYSPVFKLVMAGNHRPVVRNPDAAMRRRLHLLPLTFRPERPDPELEAALRDELPGILAWAIKGCLAWQREGLAMPPIASDATAEYFAEQDLVAQWLAERCGAKAGAEAPSAALYSQSFGHL